jgi:hypothetical protein
MGRKQHALGLHVLPVANGGRMVEVFELGTFRHAGRVEQDTQELGGIRVGLGVRSEMKRRCLLESRCRGAPGS